ncbi:MAG: hypothetical protein U1E05_19480, partial [Patescibacteria group bacterium]|nr:hypothetical protein [Patescibacteria group bacterium]
MTALYEYLRLRWEAGGFSTEDALTAFLPLVREVLEAHAAGLVAPLEGLEALNVDGPRIWFEQARRCKPRNGSAAVRQVGETAVTALEIVSEQRCLTDLAEGRDEVFDLAIGDADAPVTRPVFLPGYVAWEHRLGH